MFCGLEEALSQVGDGRIPSRRADTPSVKGPGSYPKICKNSKDCEAECSKLNPHRRFWEGFGGNSDPHHPPACAPRRSQPSAFERTPVAELRPSHWSARARHLKYIARTTPATSHCLLFFCFLLPLPPPHQSRKKRKRKPSHRIASPRPPPPPPPPSINRPSSPCLGLSSPLLINLSSSIQPARALSIAPDRHNVPNPRDCRLQPLESARLWRTQHRHVQRSKSARCH